MVTRNSASSAPLKPKSAAVKAEAERESGQRLKVAKRASMLLKFVSDPTRVHVVLMLSGGEQTVGAMCAQLEQNQPATSHHIALLRHGGIIRTRRQGRSNFYGLTETGKELATLVKVLMG
jgi:DNA-binding transcriptional ArsR family regulator